MVSQSAQILPSADAPRKTEASALLLQIPSVYRRLHAKHHKKRVQRVTETLRLTVFEQAVDVACSIAAVNITGAHPLSRTVYNMAIVWLINELHAGAYRACVLCVVSVRPSCGNRGLRLRVLQCR